MPPASHQTETSSMAPTPSRATKLRRAHGWIWKPCVPDSDATVVATPTETETPTPTESPTPGPTLTPPGNDTDVIFNNGGILDG